MSSGSVRSRSNPSPSPNRGTSWEVVEIVAEDGKRYQVRWAGKDPKTGKPWPLDWVPNSHCSPELVKAWERKKESLASASISMSPLTSVARKRLPEKRKEASTSEPPATSTRKRKHPTLSGSPGNTDEDSVPSRKRRLAIAIESATDSDRDGPSVAHVSPLPNREGPTTTEALPPHPPLEEIEMWVPTPNAKFGPPKRKRAAGERRHPPKGDPVDIAVPAKTSAQAPRHPPLPRKHLILSESQIVALREEEEESQSLPSELWPTLNRSGGPAQDTVPSDPLPPSTEDATEDSRGATGVLEGTPQGSLEQLIDQPSVDIQYTNPKPNKVHVLEPHGQGVHPRSDAMNSSTQGSVTKAPTNPSPLPTISHISLINLNPSTSATSSSKSPQPAKSSSPLIEKLGANTVKQLSYSRNESSRPGSGTLAERRALEARVRLDELRRAGASVGSLAKGHSGALKTLQSPEQPPPHVILKQVMDSMESPDRSQITAPRDPENEMLGFASPGGHSRPDLSDGSKEDPIIQNNASQGTNVVAMDVLVPSSENGEDEVPPTTPGSTPSESHNASPQASLGSQLAAALDLLHKKSEEISDLQAQVNALRGRTTDGEAKLVNIQTNYGALHDREGTDYLATGVQTVRDDEALTALTLERARWAEEKVALQGEAEALRGDKTRALADVDFFREQYQRASDFASTTRSENEELLARATLAESQAVNGVAVVRATVEARVAKLEVEVRRYKALSEMLTDRARRTDDDVRYHAALAPELERRFQQLHGQFTETEAELEETKDELRAEKRVNARLRRRIARLETTERADGGNSTEQERILWSDEKDDDEDYHPGRSPSSSPRDDDDRFSQQRQESHGPHNEDDARPADDEIELLDSVGLGGVTQSSNDDMVYLCRWRPGEPAGNCDVVVGSKQELHEHVLSHHLACH